MNTHEVPRPARRARPALILAALALVTMVAPIATTDAREPRGSGKATRPATARGAASAPARTPATARTRAGAPRTTARGVARQPPRVARGRATYPYRGYRSSYYRHVPSWYGASWYAAAYAWPYGYGAWGWPGQFASYVPGRTVFIEDAIDATAPAIVEFHVRPRRADVIVDGELVGRARDFNGRWDRLELSPGVHVIELIAEDHQSLRRVVDLRAGQWVSVEERLRDGDGTDSRSDALPDPALRRASASPPRDRPSADSPRTTGLRRGLLRLDIEPIDAAVYLDGEFLAHAGELERLHGALPVAAGLHRLEVVRPGFEPYREQIDVAADQRLTVEVTLSEAAGR